VTLDRVDDLREQELPCRRRIARLAASCAPMTSPFQSAVPVRTNVTPAAASSSKPSRPAGVFPPSGGGIEIPIGNSVLPATLRPPLGNTTTFAIPGRYASGADAKPASRR
jgi:hypothetical protein